MTRNVRSEPCAVSRTTRREFIGTMTGLGVAALIPGALRTAHSARLEKIGLQLYTVRDQMKADFEAILARHGLTAPSTHVGDTSPEAWKASLDAAKMIGHEYIVVPWIPQERRLTLDGWKRVAADFNRAAQAAHDAGLQFGYHNHDFEFPKLEGQVPYDVLLQNTDPKLVQLEIDLYWITKAGQDPLAYFSRWPGRVPLVHVKDSAGPPEHKMMDVGQGKIDWKRIFAKKDQAGIKHAFVEHDQPPQPFDDIAVSYRNLSQLEF